MRESVHQAITDPGAEQSGDRELERVDAALRGRVLDFCRDRIFDTFRMDELTKWVRHRVRCAPDSPGRILRQLRKEGKVTYELVSRRESLYAVHSVEE